MAPTFRLFAVDSDGVAVVIAYRLAMDRDGWVRVVIL